ncbi:electron transport complex protein RnfD [Candidatus Magnetoovum chiemensis]|nr:electron transport complex protein RnfD [Candidatus Magnetoovum chiemensis]
MDEKDNKRLILSSPPYIKNGETSHCLMFDVVIAAAPIIAASVLFFGLRALWIMAVSVVFALASETALQIMFNAKDFNYKRPFSSFLHSSDITISDGSALVTGLLLAFTLPVTAPFWIPALGAVFAVTIAKYAFGGLGNNIFNPALAGRAFLLAAWPVEMTRWSLADAVSGATPLIMMKMDNQQTPLLNLIVGNVAGSIGETSAVAILLGAAYLLYKKTITWHIPFSFIAAVFIITLFLGKDPFFHIFSGGVMLGAFFMATDVTTSPVTRSGRVIFGALIGVITVLIRLYGGYPEGVCYAILIMNSITPLIDRYTHRRYKHDEVDVPLINKIVRHK